MISRLAFVAIVVFFVGCMARPEQPPLTMPEKAFIDILERQCNCRTEREVNPKIRKGNKSSNEIFSEKGYYILVLDSVSCRAITEKDSLKKIANNLANQLHRKILTKDFPYDYNRIAIIFSCIPGVDQRNNALFEYTLENLNKMP
ncbi:hypothetical protein QNI19_31190 [Cytophagaceae bacterium DM2B3-1]|uniref:Lipoprotein n=1 Tax=Xanthocytophaga flava TaxID=3048013 RepID=A0ABT7CUJ8_9BACT|nr:hypothetical protein [Xanthocytophaga flavus]MDJ1467059.1 hypothetical protein [Xanthocytophaga flavus]MDJ1497445.1 hypothetical protein [Xanthocytophaga flavus]